MDCSVQLMMMGMISLKINRATQNFYDEPTTLDALKLLTIL